MLGPVTLALDTPAQHAAALARWLESRQRVLLLTGAGCSTDSGIPDYRGPQGTWKRHRPIQFSEFVASADRRRQYWARAFAGWAFFRDARPNAVHHGLAALQQRHDLPLLVTQNVDGLHQAAGSTHVLDLHGSLHRVVCLGCGLVRPRHAFHHELALHNPGFNPEAAATAPDGDHALEPHQTLGFVVPPCLACGGVVKPDVVFFGESVPPAAVAVAMETLAQCDGLLVVGSSLTVWSGLRFARRAMEQGAQVAVLTRGQTRADAWATLKLDGWAAPVLTQMLAFRGMGPRHDSL